MGKPGSVAASYAINSIYKADCVEAMSRLSAGSVDLVFADPPFNIGYDYDVYDDGQDAHTYLGWCKQWIEGLHRVLKPDGTFWLAIGDEYAAELKVLAQRDVGFHCRSWVIWYYTFGVNCLKKFSRSHVHLFHFVKDPESYTFNGHDIRIPSARQLVYGDARANPHGRLPDDTWILRPQDVADGFEAEGDMWYFPRVAGTFKERAGFHGCQMPEQLLGRIVRACSNRGDLVLDPFAGSSTTLVAAKKLRRNYLGFDISPEYVQRGTERLSLVKPGDALDGAAEPLVSAPRTADGRKRNVEFVAMHDVGPRAAAVAEATSGASGKANTRLGESVKSLVHEAFRRACRGFSSDRVVADPELNNEFLEACRELGATNEPGQLNRCLYRLRKAGGLHDIPTEHRTSFTWREYDRYLFAAEIAWQTLRDRMPGVALDDILCEPATAMEFDQLASEFAPGFSAFEYRWAALTLRKLAKQVRTRDIDLEDVCRDPGQAVLLDDLKSWEGKSGLYLILGDGLKPLYLGETLDLAARIRRQVGETELQPIWRRFSTDVRVECLPVPTLARNWQDGVRSRRLIAYRSRLHATYSPQLNLPLFSAT